MMLSELRFRKQNKDINFTSNKALLNDETYIQVDQSYYGGMFFDEIYHGRTAYEIMHDIPVYENTHPYLGKLLIIPGIKLFDMTPFGWRFTNVIFGAFFIIIAYFFALLLFREPIYGLIASFLMTYSFMHFTEARIALIDTFGVLFVFTSYLFLYQFIIKQKLRYLLLSGLFFGLASAIKWSAVFSSIGFIFIALHLLITKYPLAKRFAGYKLILYGILTYFFLSLFIYTLTFYDIYLHTGNLQSIIDYQVNMFDYHSKLTATHPYSSEWWSWSLNIKPMCTTREIINGQFSSVTIFGNPAIFWTGLIAILYLIYVSIKRKTLEASFIFLTFISLYLPYILIGRHMFIYHYYYAVPFLILAIVYGIKDFLNYYPKYSILVWIYLLIVAGLFLAFYPVLSGYEVPKSYVDNFLIWFPGWWL
jgi:dolichyl-phosphate-mannose--protein O-mannosyl transferase